MAKPIIHDIIFILLLIITAVNGLLALGDVFGIIHYPFTLRLVTSGIVLCCGVYFIWYRGAHKRYR